MSYNVAGSPPSTLYERIGKSAGVIRSTWMLTPAGRSGTTWSTRADLLQRVEHLRRRREIHVDLGAAPDGAGSDPRDAGDNADGFLDGPRQAEQLLARAERGPGGDDRHACEFELGVDGRRENRGSPHARDAEERHEQINEAALAAQDVEQRHRGAGAAWRILAPSATPYAPFVTTTSPAWSPNAISATGSLWPPTVTGRTCATRSEP